MIEKVVLAGAAALIMVMLAVPLPRHKPAEPREYPPVAEAPPAVIIPPPPPVVVPTDEERVKHIEEEVQLAVRQQQQLILQINALTKEVKKK